MSRRLLLAVTLMSGLAGCSKSPAPPAAATASAPVPHQAAPAPVVAAEPAPLPTISLGRSQPAVPSSAPAAGDSAGDARQAAIVALQPFQTLLGKWRGITRKEVSDFKGIEQPEWVWDLQTDRTRPALVMAAPDGVYFRQLRLTGGDKPETFQLMATDVEGRTRTLEGRLIEPVEQFQDGGTTVHQKFKLQFEEAGDAKDRWQLSLGQQNNDRYLVELSRIRPMGVQRIDTISNQRDGTSIAKSDTDFGEKKCIISGGLGTISVSYQGKTYWVCCTGCQAAFNEDPESWLRDAAKKSGK